MPKETRAVVLILAVWVIVAIGAALNWWSIPAPPQGFDAWSKLIASVAAATVAARVLWIVPKQLQNFLDKLESIARSR